MEEFDITDYSFLSAERMDRDNTVVSYLFYFGVTMEGTSHEYWGRDEDTKEVLTSPGVEHRFRGQIAVEVTRAADIGVFCLQYTAAVYIIVLYTNIQVSQRTAGQYS